MARPQRYTVRKLIAFEPQMVEAIEAFRVSAGITKEADAIRRLIEAGLKAEATR